MTIIEISALENGAHRNQSGNMCTIPDGWAVIPDGMEIENFPFGNVAVEEINGVMTVTSWTPGEIPEPGHEPGPVKSVGDRVTELESENNILRQQVSALSDQSEFQEELIVELANIVYA